MIRYGFTFDADTSLEFEVSEDVRVGDDEEHDLPDWARLESLRCEHCPVPVGSRAGCPAALAIRPVVEAFSTRVSFESVDVTVVRHGVRMEARMPTQEAVRCLVGLLLALSACPIMERLRPMAHFHVPFGDREHTASRFLAMHLVAQYLRWTNGQAPDWELKELLQLFGDLHRTNIRLADRIRAASEEDATVNSLVILDALADAAELSVEKGLGRLRPVFSTYLGESSPD